MSCEPRSFFDCKILPRVVGYRNITYLYNHWTLRNLQVQKNMFFHQRNFLELTRLLVFPLYHYCLLLNKTIPHYSTKDKPRLLQMLQPPLYLHLTHNRLLRRTQMDSYTIYILLVEFFSLQSCIQSLSGQDTPILTRVKIVQRLQGNIFFNVINLCLQNFVTSHTYFAKLIIFSIFRCRMSQDVATRSVTLECADFDTAEFRRCTR